VATLGLAPGLAVFGRDYADFGHAVLWPAASVQRIAGVEQLFAPNFSFRATLSRLFVDGTLLSPFPGQADRRGPLLLALSPTVVHAASTALGVAAIAAALWTCRRSADDRSRRIAAAGLLLLASALAAPSFWEHHFVVLALAGAGLWRSARPGTWACLLVPLAMTLTVPFFVALFSAGADGSFFLASREYGLPTIAAVNVLAIGIATTARGAPLRRARLAADGVGQERAGLLRPDLREDRP
jgi:hypothetical protein